MKKLHQPIAKRSDRVGSFRQKQFFSLHKDLPLSEIPQGGVSEARNVLLFGEQWSVRPGSQRIADLQFPTYFSFDSGELSKSGNTITATGELFPSDCDGDFIVWPDGLIDLITERVSDVEVTVDSDTVTTETLADIRGRLNASFFAEKIQKVFIYIGKEIYYSDFAFVEWEQLEVPYNISLTNTKSRFDEFEDSIFLRNSGGLIRIDTSSDPYAIVQINTESPDNNITVDSALTVGNEESLMNVYGRRYLYSLSNIQGGLTAHRGNGDKIIKETGTNTAPESEGYVDYRQAWRAQYFGNGYTGIIEKQYLITDVNLSYTVDLWIDVEKPAMRFTVDGETRNVFWTNDYENDDSFEDVASNIQVGLRKAFPEHEYLRVYYDSSIMRMYFFGENGISITAMDEYTESAATNMYTPTFFPPGTEQVVSINHWGVLGSASVPALQLPSGSPHQWTHFSVYSTRTLGPEWRDSNGNELLSNSLEYFVWQADVRVAGIMKVAFVGYTGAVVQSGSVWQGYFEEKDNGCVLNFQETISGRDSIQITDVVDSHNITFDELIDGEIWVAFGVDGGTSTIRSATLDIAGRFYLDTGTNLSESDIGKLIYWDDGTTGIITNIVQGATQSFNANGPLDSEEHGFIMADDLTGRNYNDVILDDDIIAREADFPCYNRFLQAMPNGDLMAIAPGFIFIANTDDTKFYYGNLNVQFQYHAGHYNSFFQYDMVKDVIKDLQDMPDHIIIFCNNSTWKEQLNVSSQITDDRIGESTTVLGGLMNVDKMIGIASRGNVADYAGGNKMVITNEPGIRVFDGYKYGPNLLYDNNGNSFINTEIEEFRNEYIAYYEPNLYGFMMFGTKVSYDKLNGSFTKSTECWRLAVERQQGYSFAQLDGDDFPFPEMGGGILRMTTTLGNRVSVVFGLDGTPYLLSTRKLPLAEDISLSYTDKATTSDGTEIDWTLGLKEYTNEDEESNLEFLEEFWYFRPQNESDKSASGFDQYGFRDAQELTVKAFVNGESSDISRVTSENPLATIHQPYETQARRIKIELNGTASSIKGTGHKLNFKKLESRELPSNVTNEVSLKRELSTDMAFWLSKGSQPLIDRTGNATHNDISQPVEYVRGPDSLDNVTVGSQTKIDKTAFYINTVTNLNYGEIPFSQAGSITFSFYLEWVSGEDPIDLESLVIYGNSGLIKFHVYADGSSSQLIFQKVTGSPITTFENIEPSKWYRVYLDNDNFYLYDSNGLVDSGGGFDYSTYESPVSVLPKSRQWPEPHTIWLHDIRLYNKTLSTNAIEYLNRDIYVKNGKSLLPQRVYTYE